MKFLQTLFIFLFTYTYIQAQVVDRDFDYYSEARYKNTHYYTDDNSTPAEKYNNKGAKLIEQKDYKNALVYLDSALLLNKVYEFALVNHGYAKACTGSYKDALKDLDLVITKMPSDTNLYFFRAKIKFFLNTPKDLASSLADYDLVLRLDPKNINAIIGKAETYAKMKDYKNAIDNYTKAIARINNDADLYNLRGKAYYSSNDFLNASVDFDKAVSLLDSDEQAEKYEIYNNRGNNKIEQAKYKDAIEDFNLAIAVDGNNVKAYSNRGIAKTHLADFLGAFDDYSIVVKKSPENYQSWYNRGLLRLEEMKDAKGSIEDFSQAAKLNPKNGVIYYQRGRAWNMLKNRSSACDDFFRSVNLGYTGDPGVLKTYKCK